MAEKVLIDGLPLTLETRGGLSRSQHYDDIRQGRWPPGVRISRRRVGWPRSETAALNAARIAGATDDEIRALVAQLVADRKFAA